MKRDWNTIREILLKTEDLGGDETLNLHAFDKDRAHEISHHVVLMEEAGLIDAALSKSLARGPRLSLSGV